tara:strand:+ start:422 stop:628 length:207 start_codon:yes stop_codon:yes gene_type:complete
MGQIAQPSLKRLIHGVDPVQQRVRLTRKEVVVSFKGLIQPTTALNRLLSLLHRITGQLEQGAEYIEIA